MRESPSPAGGAAQDFGGTLQAAVVLIPKRDRGGRGSHMTTTRCASGSAVVVAVVAIVIHVVGTIGRVNVVGGAASGL